MSRPIRSMLEDLNRILDEADEDAQALSRAANADPHDEATRLKAIRAIQRAQGEDDGAPLAAALTSFEKPLLDTFRRHPAVLNRAGFDDPDDFGGERQAVGDHDIKAVLDRMAGRVQKEGGVELAKNKEMDLHAHHPGLAPMPDSEKGYVEYTLYRGPVGYFYTAVRYVSPPGGRGRPVLDYARIVFRSNFKNFPSYVK